MARDRRMISRSISTSKKLNKVSDQSALLFSWMISHVDDWGKIEGDPETIKGLIVPIRDSFTIKKIGDYLFELANIELIWYYKEKTSENYFIEIVNFDEHQSFHGITKTPSKIDSYNPEHHLRLVTKPDLVDQQTRCGSKLNKTKLNKTKQNEMVSPTVKDIFSFCQLVLRKKPKKLNQERIELIEERLSENTINEIKLAIIEMRQDKKLGGENREGIDFFTFEYITRKKNNIQRYFESAIVRFNLDKLFSDQLDSAIDEKIKWYIEKRKREDGIKDGENQTSPEHSGNNVGVSGRGTEQRMGASVDDKHSGISRGEGDERKNGISDESANIHRPDLPERIGT